MIAVGSDQRVNLEPGGQNGEHVTGSAETEARGAAEFRSEDFRFQIQDGRFQIQELRLWDRSAEAVR
jgi:hypothetical protein